MDNDTILGFIELITIGIAIGYVCYKIGYYRAIKNVLDGDF